MAAAGPLSLSDLFPGLVATSKHQLACNGLVQCLLKDGYVVCSAPQLLNDAVSSLAGFWESPCKRNMQPAQPAAAGGCGYRVLTGDRELLEHRAGPWMHDNILLDNLLRATEQLDTLARAALGAVFRSQFVRLRASSLEPALDDLPLEPHTWASSSLQCFRYGPDSSGCSAHIDKGLLTLVYGGGPGLQVQRGDGSWADVGAVGSGEVVVMAGHMLEYATCGLVRAVEHRVVLPAGQGRQSMVYKLAARPAATINLLPDLTAAGHNLEHAALRYPQPAAVHEIMSRFNATHTSVNQPVAAEPAPAVQAGNTRAAVAAAPSREARSVSAAAPSREARSVSAAAPCRDALSVSAAARRGAQQPPAKRARPARGRQPAQQPLQAAHQPPLHQPPAGSMTIFLRRFYSDNDEVGFWVQPSTRMESVFDAYIPRLGCDREAVRFVFEGRRVFPEQTAADHCLEDGDVIDVIIAQHGD